MYLAIELGRNIGGKEEERYFILFLHHNLYYNYY